MPGTLIFTATYNEALNIGDLVRLIHQHAPHADALVVDDNSPDGTGEILDQLREEFPMLTVHHRPGKMGLGSAHLLAFEYAIEHHYDQLITMDADFSHNPAYIPALIGKLQDVDFVIGSRYVDGGQLDYGFFRTVLSMTANRLTRLMLHIPLMETTTSFRAFRVDVLNRMNLDSVKSDGYSFFVESLFYLSLVTKNMTEIPIHFEDRRSGQSKISHQEIIKAVFTLFRLAWIRRPRFRAETKLKRTE